MIRYYEMLYDELEKNDVVRKTFFDGSEAVFKNDKLIFKNTDKNPSWNNADYSSLLKPEPELAIFGSGHIAKALYELANTQEMRVTVFDEREDFCSSERFENARRITGIPYEEILKRDYNLYRPYYVILTHGHKFDKDCLRYALRHSSSYIGMIGSKNKVAQTFAELINEGFTKEELERVHAPIGLKIGAVTPEEIAISIMAQIIEVYRSEKNIITLSPEYLKTLKDNSGVIVRIIERKGSSPGALGSEMLVTEKDVYGTIGGGNLENEAIKTARKMLKNKESSLVKEYGLNANDDLKMICGGEVKVHFFRTEA